MSKQIFINLPVKDLNKSVAFFTELGFTFNPQFTDENATCMIISDNIFVMLLVENFFRTFITSDITDAQKNTEVILSISADSRKEVDEIVDKAIAAGGSFSKDPQDHGWMYNRNFRDLDGHYWEFAYIDASAIPQS
jgi:uncharacterized protein